LAYPSVFILDVAEKEKGEEQTKTEDADNLVGLQTKEESQSASISEGTISPIEDVSEQIPCNISDFPKIDNQEQVTADEHFDASNTTGISIQSRDENISQTEERTSTTATSNVPELNEKSGIENNETESANTTNQTAKNENELKDTMLQSTNALIENLTEGEGIEKEESSTFESFETIEVQDCTQEDLNESKIKDEPQEKDQATVQTVNQLRETVPCSQTVTEGEREGVVSQIGEGIVAHKEQERTKEPEPIYPNVREVICTNEGK